MMESFDASSSLITTTDSSSVHHILEMEVDDQEEPLVQQEHLDFKVPQAPCVVCFVPVVGVEDKYRLFEPLDQEEEEHDKLFQWFLLNFRTLTKKAKGKYKNKKQVERFDDLLRNKKIG